MRTILVIDDDAAFLVETQKMSADAGYRVLQSSDGLRAVRLLDEMHGEIDLAIVDLALPGLNGFELIGALSRRPNPVKIIATSGVYKDEQLRTAAAVGAHAVIRKPVSAKRLPKQDWLRTIEQTHRPTVNRYHSSALFGASFGESMNSKNTLIAEVLDDPKTLDEWLRLRLAATSRRAGLIQDLDLRRESAEFLKALQMGVRGDADDFEAPSWNTARELLADLSRSRARQGFTPSETATFVLSLKQPLFQGIQEHKESPAVLMSKFWRVNSLLDRMALLTTEVYTEGSRGGGRPAAAGNARAVHAGRQALGWHLAVPLIGTLDSERTQIVMESLLQQIVETGAAIAIIDITGVPTVDTLVAQHLLKTVAAARLMGADCIISGIRPQIAQTIVHLGVDLGNVITKATLADAFAVALQRLGLTVEAHSTAHASQGETSWNAIPILKHGRLPAGHHPGGHARPPGHDPAGRPDRARSRRPAPVACSSTSRRWKSWIPSSAA